MVVAYRYPARSGIFSSPVELKRAMTGVTRRETSLRVTPPLLSNGVLAKEGAAADVAADHGQTLAAGLSREGAEDAPTGSVSLTATTRVPPSLSSPCACNGDCTGYHAILETHFKQGQGEHDPY